MYGETLLTGPLDTITDKSGKTTFDLMEIHSTAIQIHRSVSTDVRKIFAPVKHTTEETIYYVYSLKKGVVSGAVVLFVICIV